jgi:uncharacterized protein (TIGR02452 family)
MTTTNTDFNHQKWLQQFESATAQRQGVRDLRASIYADTVRFVRAGGYIADGCRVLISNENITESTAYFVEPEALIKRPEANQTHFSVINADCLESAHLLLAAGLNPCVLNLASRQNPGGGVLNGAGAQEENIFRRTNLFMSLYQFTSYAHEYGIARSNQSYPLDKNTGGIYSHGVTVFRGSEKNGYCLLKRPFQVAFVTVPALNHPELTRTNGILRIADSLVAPTGKKIRTILRIAGKYNHNALVLGAFGCGAFANPPNHIAELFYETFQEDEFLNRFQTVVFSIFDDHNSCKEHNPDGNVLPFLNVFGK